MNLKTQSTTNGKIPATEREEIEDWLWVITGWNRTIFERMTDEKIQRIWKERVEDR